MAKGRTELLVGLIVLGIGLALGGFLGLWGYMASTATPVHPSAEEVSSVTQSSPPPQWADAVARGRQTARSGLADQNLPGLSAAVGIDGDLVWAEGFGFADLRTGVPVTPDHRFRIGTASTALASAAAGLLLETGRLKLDDEIQTYVPAFPKKQWPVTLREVMGHTAGVISDGGGEGPLLRERCERPVEPCESPVASVHQVVRRRQPPRPPATSHAEAHPRLLMRQGAAAVRPRQPACGGSSTAFRPKRASSLGCHGRTAAARGRMTAGKWVSAG